MAPIPITIITGFLGSGKTTLILNLLPQLRRMDPNYRLALLKNEYGDLAVDSQLASASAISGVQELLNGCICCNLVGQLGEALEQLSGLDSRPNRIVLETSGSAFPATLAIEVNRLARRTGRYTLDGVVSVIDVENWQGYEDTSYTAKVQARYTDLLVLNKWEAAGERRLDEVLDRVGDIDVDTAWVRSRKGWVDMDVVFGTDGALAKELGHEHPSEPGAHAHGNDHNHSQDGENEEHHTQEVEVLSATLENKEGGAVDAARLMSLLRNAPRDEVYRIKAVLTVRGTLENSDPDVEKPPADKETARWILNWAFGRWMFTRLNDDGNSGSNENNGEHKSSDGMVARMS